MNKIANSIVFLFSLNLYAFNGSCLPNHKNFKIYYLNGINNSEEESTFSSDSLGFKINKKINTLYNYSEKIKKHSFLFIDFIYPFSFKDIKEVSSQKTNEVFEKISKKTINEVKKMYSKLYFDSNSFIIAHSQGNLFANELCLLNQNRKKIKVLGIATPANMVRCGDRYITHREDRVISFLSENSDFYHFLKPLPPNFINGKCSSLSFCHNFINAYVNYDPSFHAMRDYIEDYEKNILKEMDFNLTSLKIYSSEEKPSFVEKTIDKVVYFKDSADLFFRKQKARATFFSYCFNLWKETPLWSLITFSLKDKDIEKIANVTLNINSNQEYADIAGYGAELYDEYACKKLGKYSNKKSDHYCEKVKDFNYFSLSPLLGENELDKLNLKINAKDQDVFKAEDDLTLNVNCLDVQDKSLPISIPINLSYNPQKNKTAEILVNNMKFNIFSKNLSNFGRKTEDIIISTFYEEDDKIKVKYEVVKKDLNFTNLDLVEENFKECDSMRKMTSKKCEDYFEKVLSSKK